MQYPHIEWLNLKNDGILVECAIIKKDANNNIYHIPVANLDSVDKKRLRDILTGRNARNFPLWDLMLQTTLGNGVNAMEYFHQLVKVRTPHGQIIDPTMGRIGAAQRHVAKPAESSFAASTTTAAPTSVNSNVVTESEQKPAAPEVGQKDTRTPAEKRKATMAAKKAKD